MNIFDLKFNEKTCLEDNETQVTRVPGGWIYRFWDYRSQEYPAIGGVFVPLNNEFSNE